MCVCAAGFSLKPSNTTDHHNNNNNNNNNNHTAAAAAGQDLFMFKQEMESRIIGGQEAWAHSWPWQVSLRFATMPACGGAIISPLWVISAAHCFKRSEVISSLVSDTAEVGVSMIINHYGYNTRTKESDMALLKLQRPVVFNQFVRPIDLWMTPLPVHRKCTITGWGSTPENVTSQTVR
uniref:Peptidase S1 domain-containing protein n=1 Tax=Lates calcarifer TaxID=8187 RepID=A0A4W6BYB7_LATCA